MIKVQRGGFRSVTPTISHFHGRPTDRSAVGVREEWKLQNWHRRSEGRFPRAISGEKGDERNFVIIAGRFDSHFLSRCAIKQFDCSPVVH